MPVPTVSRLLPTVFMATLAFAPATQPGNEFRPATSRVTDADKTGEGRPEAPPPEEN